jgi:hypothetical protein
MSCIHRKRDESELTMTKKTVADSEGLKRANFLSNTLGNILQINIKDIQSFASYTVPPTINIIYFMTESINI